MTMFRHRYRSDLRPELSEAIRLMRREGYAVVVLKSDPLERKSIEDRMLRAARKGDRHAR